MTNYNGWKNRQTWNVMLWINNDECLYNHASKFMKSYAGSNPYMEFIRKIGLATKQTPDNIKWVSTMLDYKALNDAMLEFKG